MKKRTSNIPGLNNLQKENWGQAIDCLTDAFSEDACFKYLLRSEVIDPAKARFIHEYTLKYSYSNGEVFVTSKNVEGVSIWLPPETNNHTSLIHVWNFIISGGLKMDKLVHPGTIDMMRKYGTYSSNLHHKYAKGPHWYLMSLGVAKEFQGMGFSKKLLLPMLDYLDKHGQSCYLETHNSDNVPYYERFGFLTMEVGTLPGSDKKHWAMLRKPNSTGQS